MKKEFIKGYLLDEEEVGCERYPYCFDCPLEDCTPKKESEKRKQQKKEAAKRYRQRHKDREKERKSLWRDKQRLAKLLDQQRDTESTKQSLKR